MTHVRIIKCSRCGHKQRQRMEAGGRFTKITECPECGAKNSFGTLRVYTHVPGNDPRMP